MKQNKLKRFDFSLFLGMILLIVMGLAILNSLSLRAGEVNYFKKQAIFVVIGLVVFFIISFTDFRFFKSTTYWIYILTIFLLIAVLVFGREIRGVQGWLDFGFFNFQPTEIAKIVAILVLAKFWQEARRPIKVADIIISFLLISPLAYLIIKQPDLGSALLIVIISLGVLFLVDHNKKHLISLFLIIIILLASSWFFVLKDYQKTRILNFLKPQSRSQNSAYQIQQSKIAVGSGKVFGRGFGLGTQSQLRFLPESHNDFVFAVLAEEFGFIGCLLLLGIYIFVIFRLIKISLSVYDNFSMVLGLGVVVYLFLQMVVTVSINIGLFPIIGLPLPFISYGGSSLLVSMLALALVESSLIHQPFLKS